MFDSLPNTLVASILESLDLKDYPQISLTCRRFFQIISDNRKFWTRECLTRFLSFELDPYSEIYDLQDYKTHIKQKALNSQKSSYKKLLIDGFNYQSHLAEVLCNLGSQDRVTAFMNYFFETLKLPLLPLASLKRETIFCNPQTIFQNKLCEVLYEDSSMVVKTIGFPSEHEELINELLNYEEKILKESMSCNRENQIKCRWYGFELKDSELENSSPILVKGFKSNLFSKSLDSTTDDVQNIKNNSILLDLYNCLCNTITHFCRILSFYLNSLDNTYELLSEYVSRWNTYVSTMLELEQTFKTFSELMNKTYENTFEGYPSFPKFSIWRLMTKIWLQEVYERSNLNLNLNEAFLRILGNLREQHIQESINVNFGSPKSDENNMDELPKLLYVNLRTKNKKKSTIQYKNADKCQNLAPSCLRNFREAEKKLLSSYLKSILDISLNEVSVHYIDCTELCPSYPYRETEDSLLEKSNEFYSEYQILFSESPDYFCQFLKLDCALISEIVPLRTSIKLETILIHSGLQFNKEFLQSEINKMDLSDLEKADNEAKMLNDNTDEVTPFIENFLEEIIKHESCMPIEKPCSNFYDLPPLDIDENGMEEVVLEENNKEMEDRKEEEEDSLFSKYADKKALAKRLTNYFDAEYPNFKANFEYLYQRLQEFEKIKEKDQFIKETNTNKNIPFEMGDVDRIFYDLDKTVELCLLHKLAEDYNNLNVEDKNTSKIMDLPPLDEVMGQGMEENGLGDLGFDPNQLDFSNLDLFNLENPTLRRAPI